MLTVKYIDTNGVESVYPALSVQFFPDVPKPEIPPSGDYASLITGVLVFLPDGSQTQYGFIKCRSAHDYDPKVYVMNELGKTVATYSL